MDRIAIDRSNVERAIWVMGRIREMMGDNIKRISDGIDLFDSELRGEIGKRMAAVMVDWCTESVKANMMLMDFQQKLRGFLAQMDQGEHTYSEAFAKIAARLDDNSGGLPT